MDFFDLLDDSDLDEFPWLNGIEGGHFITDLAAGRDFFETVDAYVADDRAKIQWMLDAYQANQRKHKRPRLHGPAQPTQYSLTRTNAAGKPIGYWVKPHAVFHSLEYNGPPLTAFVPRNTYKPGTVGREPSYYPAGPGVNGIPDSIGRSKSNAYVYLRPEGAGKSSIVPKLIKRGCKVVFCSKSNKQLEAQERGFRERWPELRIQRYVSRGQNLTDFLERMGIKDFKVVLRPTVSPYASEAIDKTGTIDAIEDELIRVGHDSTLAEHIFVTQFKDYKAPKMNGLELDVMMLTISAFQSMATSYRHAWWELLGLTSGTFERQYIDDYGMMLKYASQEVIRESDNRYQATAGHKNVVVILDDPDYTDFDWLRLIDDDDKAETLYHSTRPRKTSTVKYWLEQGMGELTAMQLASVNQSLHPRGRVLHNIKTHNGHHFEQRPLRNTLGFGRKRGPKAPLTSAIA